MFYEKAILHLDLDTFFVSVERLKDSRLQGVPLIVGGKSDRAVVASCSYETRQYGVHSGMSMRMARYLCPDALVISGDMERYSYYSRLITDIIEERAPLFEKASIDEFYVDLVGMDRFFGCYKWSGELRQTIMRESGLPISLGLSVNKMVSKVATGEAKPNGQLEVPNGIERDFLAPMPVSKIPMVGEKTSRFLASMGIQKVHTLRDMPPEMLVRMLGKMGTLIWERANAIDKTPVMPYMESKSISTENTFETDTTDIEKLESLILAMAEKLGFQLRQTGRMAGCITIKIRYADFNTFTKQAQIPYTSSDQVLMTKGRELFRSLYDRRLLIRLVGVRLSDLVHGHHQIDLFEDTEKVLHLHQAIDRLKNKYGSSILFRGAGLQARKFQQSVIPTDHHASPTGKFGYVLRSRQAQREEGPPDSS